MLYRVSLNEITTISSRALQTIGFPPGIDVENGKNIGWLEAHHLGGLDSLCEEIRTFKGRPGPHFPILKQDRNKINILGESQSGFLIAQSAIDLAETKKTIYIENCIRPLILFAELSRRSHLTFAFRITWLNDNLPSEGFSRAGYTSINETMSESKNVTNVTIETIAELNIDDEQTMANRFKHSLSNGILVDFDQWKLIIDTASKLLVPNNEISHSSAGAEVDDNL